MNRQDIEQAIAALQAQRSMLGDPVVDASLAALRHQLAGPAHQHISNSALRGERKQVTVMFADISGFTAMSEKLDPEEVRSTINACFERLGAAIDRYGGHIDKFIGDEIMALFGAPLAHENDPERALRAALDMMTALADFNREHAGQLPKPLALHFGINSGLVIAGGIGTAQRQDYSVMGDTVNLAARLEDLSEAGEILVGEATYRRTAPMFEFEALPPVTVKGKARPVQVYRLLKTKTVRAGQVRGIEGLSSPLVGRTQEMALLKAALQKFYQADGSIITVTGEAGLGKSRLVQELEAMCRYNDGSARWAFGRALSHADSASYLAARDMLRGILEIAPEAAPAEVATSLRHQLQASLPVQADDLFAYLGYLLDVPLTDAERQQLKYLDGRKLHQLVIQAAGELIAAKSRQTPLVLVWEDLHWADPSSLELLEELLPLTHKHALLLVLVYRPPVATSRMAQFHQNLTTAFMPQHLCIDLPPLTPAESTELLHNLLGQTALPQPVVNKIVAKAEGNPFYLEEVIRSLLDSGALLPAEDGRGWTVAANLEQISLPDTLQGIIMARIDQLEPPAKRSLQVAAVIGRTFSTQILEQVLRRLPDEPAVNLSAHLLNLENSNLIARRQNGAEAAFLHVFTQESVYNSLLRSDRRQIHQQVGEALEHLMPGDADTLLRLGYHFEQGQDRPRALAYLRRAAMHAAATYANHEANALFKRALAQLDPTDFAARWDILLEQEQVLDRLAARHEQADLLIQMQTLAELLADDRRLGLTHNRRAIYFDKISEYRAAAEAAEVGLRVAHHSGNEHLQAQSLNLLALTAWRRYDYREVQRWAEKALEALKVIGDPAERVTSLFHLGRASYRLGQYDLALRYTQAAQELTRDTGNRDGEAVSHVVLGWIYQRLGDYDRAEQHFLAKYSVRQTLRDRYGEASALSHLGWLAYDQEKPEAGLDYCWQALEIAREIHAREHESGALSGMALNYELLGELNEARRYYQSAVTIHDEIGATTLAIFDRAGLARIALAQNNPDAAETCIKIVSDWVLSGNAQKFWDPWIIYLSSYEVLTALGYVHTAQTILAEAHTVLQQRAGQISDENLRHCFLTRVKANRNLEQAWNSVGVYQ